jgi:excisionase family DNA binding protein
MGDINEYMTTREAAEALGLSKARIDQFVRTGRLTAVTVGNARLILRAEVEAMQKEPRPPGRPKKPDPPPAPDQAEKKSPRKGKKGGGK